MAISQMVGASIKRREDPRLVTGTGSYVDDISQTAVVHMHVVRSSEAHARILGIETARPREPEGAFRTSTGKGLKRQCGAPCRAPAGSSPPKTNRIHTHTAPATAHY